MILTVNRPTTFMLVFFIGSLVGISVWIYRKARGSIICLECEIKALKEKIEQMEIVNTPGDDSDSESVGSKIVDFIHREFDGICDLFANQERFEELGVKVDRKVEEMDLKIEEICARFDDVDIAAPASEDLPPFPKGLWGIEPTPIFGQ